MLEALRYAVRSTYRKIVICSDSMSTLQAIGQVYPKHPLAQQITDQRAHMEY
jgi:hypothetical protein